VRSRIRGRSSSSDASVPSRWEADLDLVVEAIAVPVWCQNSAEQLRGPAIVVVEHPTQPFAALDPAA